MRTCTQMCQFCTALVASPAPRQAVRCRTASAAENSSKSGEVGGEAVGRLQSVGMVVAEHAAAGQRILVQLAGGLVLTKRTQVAG